MRNAIVLIAILASTAVLGGCSTMGGPGIYNGLSDPWEMFTVGRGDGKPIDLEQCQLLDTIAREEFQQVKLQLSSPTEAAASNAIPYGMAGIAGGIVDRFVTAIGGGVAGTIGGAFSGLQTWSYSAVWTVWEGVYNRLDYLKSIGDPRVKTLFIRAAFVRANNSVCGPLLKAASVE